MGVDVAPPHTAVHRKSIRFPLAETSQRSLVAGSDLAKQLSPAARFVRAASSFVRNYLRCPPPLKLGLPRPSPRFFPSPVRDSRLRGPPNPNVLAQHLQAAASHSPAQPHPSNSRPLCPRPSQQLASFNPRQHRARACRSTFATHIQCFSPFATAAPATLPRTTHNRHRPAFIRDSFADSCARRLLCPYIQQKSDPPLRLRIAASGSCLITSHSHSHSDSPLPIDKSAHPLERHGANTASCPSSRYLTTTRP